MAWVDPNCPVETQWFAVRCCCQPTKVLGFLRLRSDAPGSVPVRRLDDQVFWCEVKDVLDYENSRGDQFPTNERAIYSDDRNIEFWRGVAGFVEVTGAENGR